MNVTSMSKDFDAVERYLMTASPAMKTMKEVEDGTSIPVAGWLEFTDEKKDGEVVEIMSVITPGREVYSCQSSTFKRSLHDIDEIMAGRPYSVIKSSGKTKAGRDFINCYLDLNSVE